jgi:hypothetical protein
VSEENGKKKASDAYKSLNGRRSGGSGCAVTALGVGLAIAVAVGRARGWA